MATYLEQYQYYLEEQMAAGGTPERMEDCVRQYNAVGRLDFRPGKLYAEWSSAAKHLCTSCQTEFVWSAELPPDPTQEVTCEKCLESAKQPAEPVRDVPAEGQSPPEDPPA